MTTRKVAKKETSRTRGVRGTAADGSETRVDSAVAEDRNVIVFQTDHKVLNGRFNAGQMVDVDESGLDEIAIEALLTSGVARRATVGEIDQFDGPLANMHNPDPLKRPLDNQNTIIVTARGVDIAYPDFREQGPAEATSKRAGSKNTLAMQQWDENPAKDGGLVTRLPHNVGPAPSATPLSTDEAARTTTDALPRALMSQGGNQSISGEEIVPIDREAEAEEKKKSRE